MNLVMEFRKISPAPNWTSIFTLRPDLEPPGFAEVFVDMIENPRVKQKELKQEETRSKKKKRALGRNEKN